MERPTLRKPKLFFDTAPRPNHVTFDDGTVERHNLPWGHYVEGRWDYADLATIKMEFANWVIQIKGNNLGPLFLAIEEQTLLRLQAHPELQGDLEREADTFASEIRFIKPAKGQTEFDLGLR